MTYISNQQADKLSELTLDLAKASFIASIALPVVTDAFAILSILRYFILGLILTYASLKLIDGG